MTDDDALNALWNSRIQWSQAADIIKRRIDRARLAALCLSSLGAIATTLSATVLPPPGLASRIAAAAGAVFLASATFVTAQFLNAESVRRWVRARAVSEAIKQQVFRFRAQCRPFSGTAAMTRLQADVAAIEDGAADLVPHLPDAARAGSAAPPPALKPADYVRLRIEQQISDYYRPRARRYARNARRLRILALGLSLAATIIAAVNTALVTGDAATKVAPWAAVLTTLGGAVVAYLGSRRYEFLVISYHATARRLEQLRDRWRADGSPTDETSWSTFVNDCETALALENESWLAKWSDVKAGT